MLDKRTTVIFAVLAVGLALVSGEVTREGDKITIRTKRQQCVCIVVSPASNQLQCNCDNTQPAITPQVQQQQQQELQQQLQQIQSPPAVSGATGSDQTTCGCVLIVIKVLGAPGTTSVGGSAVQGSNTQHPQYQCQCTNTPQANVPTTGSANFLQDQISNRNFLSSALNQADYLGNNINTFQQPQQTQQTQPSPQPLANAFTQSPLTAYQNTAATSGIQAPVVPQNYLNSALNQANYLNTAAAAGILPQQTQGLYNNQQLPTSQFTNYQQDPSISQFDSEPATTTCITIAVPGSCTCGGNYVQCADNMCCHKRYRSQKSEESAMDIIVDVLKNIKDRLDRS